MPWLTVDRGLIIVSLISAAPRGAIWMVRGPHAHHCFIVFCQGVLRDRTVGPKHTPD